MPLSCGGGSEKSCPPKKTTAVDRCFLLQFPFMEFCECDVCKMDFTDSCHYTLIITKYADIMRLFLMGKSRNRRTFLKIENLRFLKNYDNYNCIFGIKLKGLSLSFI